MRENRIAICIAGWHYNKDFYSQVCRLSQAKIFVVSHKPPLKVPCWLFDHMKPSQVFFEPNLGYDWGCYQQFLAKGIWREFNYVFFMHDDLVIKNTGFVDRCIELFEEGYNVVANGRVAPKNNWPSTHAECYAHSSWKPSTRRFQHDVVRGSFFCATREALERLRSFEVFWDPFHLTSGFGNWSTRATCGKWEYVYGEKCFGFLSEDYYETDYLVELVRGRLGGSAMVIDSPRKRRLVNAIRSTCRLYMSIYWRERFVHLRAIVLGLMNLFILIVSGTYSSRLSTSQWQP